MGYPVQESRAFAGIEKLTLPSAADLHQDVGLVSKALLRLRGADDLRAENAGTPSWILHDLTSLNILRGPILGAYFRKCF